MIIYFLIPDYAKHGDDTYIIKNIDLYVGITVLTVPVLLIPEQIMSWIKIEPICYLIRESNQLLNQITKQTTKTRIRLFWQRSVQTNVPEQ